MMVAVGSNAQQRLTYLGQAGKGAREAQGILSPTCHDTEMGPSFSFFLLHFWRRHHTCNTLVLPVAGEEAPVGASADSSTDSRVKKGELARAVSGGSPSSELKEEQLVPEQSLAGIPPGPHYPRTSSPCPAFWGHRETWGKQYLQGQNVQKESGGLQPFPHKVLRTLYPACIRQRPTMVP